MSIYSNKNTKKKSRNRVQSLIDNNDTSEEKPIPLPAGGGANSTQDSVAARIASRASSQFGERNTEINTASQVGVEDSYSASPSMQESLTDLDEEVRIQGVEEITRIIRESFEASAEDIRISSELFNFYNTRADIISLEQSDSLKILYNNLFLSNLREDFDQNISLLSHENYKITSQPTGPLIGSREIISNGPFIDPDQLFLLKTNYIDNKLNLIKNGFFTRNKHASNNQLTYLNSIKENNIFKKNYISKVGFFLDNNKSELKKNNFGNQLIDYINNKEYSNYFGKVSNIIYSSKKKDYAEEFVTFHENNDYLNLDSSIKNENFDSSRYLNLKSVLENYFKVKTEDSNDTNTLLSSTIGDIVDSNILITKALLNCALSLKNIHEGSFTSINYNKQSDLNYEVYNTISSNDSLRKIPILTHAYEYDIFSDIPNEIRNRLNFTSPAYTNSRYLPFKHIDNFTFKDDSIYKLDQIYNNDKIPDDHFLSINFLQRSNNRTKTYFYNYYPDGDTFRDALLFNNLIHFDHSWLKRENYGPNFSEDSMHENISLSFNEYLSQRNNLLDVDAIVLNHIKSDNAQPGLSLIYVDSESQIRKSKNNDKNRLKYLSCPTFNLFCINSSKGIDGSNKLKDEYFKKDDSFENAFNQSNNDVEHNTISYVNRNDSIYIKRVRSRRPNGDNPDWTRKIPLDFLRINNKAFNELDSNRILYAHELRIPDIYLINDSINEGNFNDNLAFFIDRMWSIKNNNTDAVINSVSLIQADVGKDHYRSINFRKAKMGAGERFLSHHQPQGEYPAITDRNKVPTILDKKYHPFVLVRNTNKFYDYE